MYSMALKRLNNKGAGFFLPLAAIAVSVSAALYALWSLELKWALFGFMGLLFPFVLAMVPNVQRFLLGLLIFVIPLNVDYNFLLHPSPGGADAISLGLTDILLVALIGHWLMQTVQFKRPGAIRFFPAITWPSLALIVMSGISTLAAKDLLWSAFDLINFAKALLFFFFLANNLRRREDIAFVLQAFFLGLLVQTLIIAMQYYKGANIGLLGLGEPSTVLAFEMEMADIARPGGTIGHCNHLARYIGLLLPIAYVLSFVAKSRSQRWLAGLTSIAGTVALIYTLTRSSWLALGLSIALMLAYMFVHRLFSMRILSKVCFAFLLLAGVIALFSQVIWGRLTTYDLGSAKTRVTTARVAWKIIQDHPLIGIGINNYGSVLPKYWSAEDRFTKRAAVHNTYLLYAAEIGLIGFAAFLWLIISLFLRIRKAMHGRSQYLTAVAIGVMGSFAGFALAALADKSYKENFTLLLVFWGLAAIIEAIIRLDEDYRQTTLALLGSRKVHYEL